MEYLNSGPKSYHSANAAIQHDNSQDIHSFSEQTTNALVKLTAATATDRAALAALTFTNEHLAKQLLAVTKNLTAAQQKSNL